MIYLFCAIASSAAVSAVLRIGDRKCTGKYSRFAMNYLSAAVFAFLTMQSREFVLVGPACLHWDWAQFREFYIC